MFLLKHERQAEIERGISQTLSSATSERVDNNFISQGTTRRTSKDEDGFSNLDCDSISYPKSKRRDRDLDPILMKAL
jgi:hypothetical protein